MKGYGQKYFYHPNIAQFEIIWGCFTGAIHSTNDRVGSQWNIRYSPNSGKEIFQEFSFAAINESF